MAGNPGMQQSVMVSGTVPAVTVVPEPIPIPNSTYPGMPRVVPAPVAFPTPSVSGDNRVTLWNRSTKRKIAGQAAPMQKNLGDYLSSHPDCELYNGQDARLSPEEKKAIIAAQNRISIWNKATKRRISGNAAPTEKKLGEYLRKHPECEVYNGQDKQPSGGRPYVPPTKKNATPSAQQAANNAKRPGSGMPPSFPLPPSGPHVGSGLGGQHPWDSLPPPMPIQNHNASIEDMYGMEGLHPGELPIMPGSLEDMLSGMSLDELGTFSGSHPTVGSLGGDYNSFFGNDEMGMAVPAPVEKPMSSAQRIKRDRTFSMSSPRSRAGLSGSLGSVGSSLAGSLLAPPMQRLRQGPGPGSVPQNPDIADPFYFN